MKRKQINGASWCPEHGPNVMVDADGLCAGCGATCMGDGADEALKALANQRTPAETAVVRAAKALLNRVLELKAAEDCNCCQDIIARLQPSIKSLMQERKRGKS